MDFRMKVFVWWVIVVLGEAGVARFWSQVHEGPARQMGARVSQDLINGSGNVARNLRDHTLSGSRVPRGYIGRIVAALPDPVARASRDYIPPDEGTTPHDHTARPEADDEPSDDHTARSEVGTIIPHDRSKADSRTLRDHDVVQTEEPHNHTAGSSVTGARAVGDHTIRPDSETLGPYDHTSPPVADGGIPHQHHTAPASDDGASGLAITSTPHLEPRTRSRSRLVNHTLKNTWKSHHHHHHHHQMNRTDTQTTGGSSASEDIRKNVVLTPNSTEKLLQSVSRTPEIKHPEPQHPDDKSQEDSYPQAQRRERKLLKGKNPESQYPEGRPSGAKGRDTQHSEKKAREVNLEKKPRQPEDLKQQYPGSKPREARDFKTQHPQHPGMKPPFAGVLGTQQSEKKPSEAGHLQPKYSQFRLSRSETGSAVVGSPKSSSSKKTSTYVESRRPQYSKEKPTGAGHLEVQYPNSNHSDKNYQEARDSEKKPQEFKYLEAQYPERKPSDLWHSEKKPQEIRYADQRYLERRAPEVRRLEPRHLETEPPEEIHQNSPSLTEKPLKVKYQEVPYSVRLHPGVRYLDPQQAERKPSEDTFPELQEQRQQQLQKIYLQPQVHEERYPSEVRYYEKQQPIEQPMEVWIPVYPEPQQPRYEPPVVRYLELQQPDTKPQEVRYLELQQPDIKPQEVRYLDLQQPDTKPPIVKYPELQQPVIKPQEVRYLEPQLPQRRPIEIRYQNPELWTGALDDSDIMLTEPHKRIRRAQVGEPIDSQRSENDRHFRIISRSGSPSEGHQSGQRAQMERYLRLLRSAERPEGEAILGKQNTGGSRYKIVYEPIYGKPHAPNMSRPVVVNGSGANLPHQYPRPVRINVDDYRNRPPTDDYHYPGVMVTLERKDESPNEPVGWTSTADGKVSSDPRLRDKNVVNRVLLPTYSNRQHPAGEATASIDGSPAASASHRRVPHNGRDLPRLPGNFDRIKNNQTDTHTVGIHQQEMNGSFYPYVSKQQRQRLNDENVHFAGAPLPALSGSRVPLRQYYLIGVPRRDQTRKVFLPQRDVDRTLSAPVTKESIIATTTPRIVPKQGKHLIDFFKTPDDDDVDVHQARNESIKRMAEIPVSGKNKGDDNMDGSGNAKVNEKEVIFSNDSDSSDGYGNSTVAGVTSDRGSENCTWTCDSAAGDGNRSGAIDSNATDDSGLEEIVPKASGDFPSEVVGPRHSKTNSSNVTGSDPSDNTGSKATGSKTPDDHKPEYTSDVPETASSEATGSKGNEDEVSLAYDKSDASDGEEPEDPGEDVSKTPDTKDPVRHEPEDSSRTSVDDTEGKVDHDVNVSEGNNDSVIIVDRDSKFSKNTRPHNGTQVDHDDKPGIHDDGLEQSPATDEKESKGSDDDDDVKVNNNATTDGKSVALVDSETEDFRNGSYEASRSGESSTISGNDTDGVSRDSKFISSRDNVSNITVKDEAGLPGNDEVSGSIESDISASTESEVTERDEYEVSRYSKSVSENDETEVSENDKDIGSEGDEAEVSGKGESEVSERDESEVSIGESDTSGSDEHDSSVHGKDVTSGSESEVSGYDESDESGNGESENTADSESESSTKESQIRQNHEVDYDHAKKSSDDEDDGDDGDDDDDDAGYEDNSAAEGSPDDDDGDEDDVQNGDDGDSLDDKSNGDAEDSTDSSDAIASVSLMMDEKEGKDLMTLPLDVEQTVKDTSGPSKDDGNVVAYESKVVSTLNKRNASVDEGDDVSPVEATAAEEDSDTSLEKDSTSANDYSESDLRRDTVSVEKDTANVFDSEVSNRLGKNGDGVVLDNITDTAAASGEGNGERDSDGMVGQKVIDDLANGDGETPSGKEDVVVSTEKEDGSVDTEKEDGSVDTEKYSSVDTDEENGSVDTEKENESLGKESEDHIKKMEELVKEDGSALTDEDVNSIAEEGDTTDVEDAGSIVDEGSGTSADEDAGSVSEAGSIRREGKAREAKLIKMDIRRGYGDVLNEQK